MKLFDSKSGELKDLIPLTPGEVGIYVCGPTVQSAPHIGHLRSALVYDLLTRWLEANGLQVTLVRNVTDIDDKVLEKAKESGDKWWALAYANELVFSADYSKLGIQRPTYEPRATGHIPQMIELIQILIEKGHAYQALDGSADVYFDSASWSRYGELTNQSIDEMEDGEASTSKKRNTDFALWKAIKPSEPQSAAWDSPWGKGRPGWHIECSAMSSHYLGTQFDIHGGGLDLRFPHHENELAQSAAAGHKFANLWMHNGLVNVSGQKMSKSLGNSVTSKDLFALASPEAVRYYLLSAHYRSVLDYQPGVLSEAEVALERISGFLERAERVLSKTQHAQLDSQSSLPEEFVVEMNDDLNIPAALAVIHEFVRNGNTALDEERLREANNVRSQLVKMLEVLGLAPSQWAAEANESHKALDVLVQALIAERNEARENKDYARADTIRDRLSAAGIELSDDANSTHWSLS
jgi:cysteinyl-tRNA synthetase